MKIFTLLAAPLAALISCSNVGLPQTLTIKSNATYSAKIGFDAVDFSEHVSAKTIQSLFGADANVKVYDYNPGARSDVQHFLTEHRFVHKSLDVSDAVSGLEAADSMAAQLEVSRTFSVPDLNTAASTKLPVRGAAGAAAQDINESLPVSLSVGLKNAESPVVGASVERGKIVVSAARAAGWQGVTATPNITLQGAGISQSVAKNDDGFDSEKYILYSTVSLDGKQIRRDDITVSGSVSFFAPRGTPQASSVEFFASVQIEKFESVTVDLGKDLGATSRHAIPMEKLENFVSEVEYAQLGFRFSYTNTLPPGNDLTVYAELENAGGAPFPPATIASGKANQTAQLISHGGVFSTARPAAIKTRVALPGATAENPSHIVVKNVSPGESYLVEMKVSEIVFDWTQVTIDGARLPVSGTIGLPIDIGGIFATANQILNGGFDELFDAVTFPEIPVYVFFARPEILRGTSIEGTMDLKSSSGAQRLLDGAVNLSTQAISFEKNGGAVVSSLDALSAPPQNRLTKLSGTALAQMVNGKQQNIRIDYDFRVAGGQNITVTKSEFERIKNGGGSVAVEAVLYVDIPLDMTVAKDVSLDMLRLTRQNRKADLLNREGALDIDGGEFAKYVAAVKSVSFSFELLGSAGKVFPGGAAFYIKDKDATTGVLGTEAKKVSVSHGSTELASGQIVRLLSTYPYMPEMMFSIPQGSEIKIPAACTFGLLATAIIKTDGAVSFDLGGGG